MIETAVRAEQVATSGYPGPYYTWEVSGKPISVAIPLSMMDRLEQETVLSFRSLSSRGSEIGGVLFGTAAPGKPALVTISSYEPVACDYTLGPLYHLSEADLSQMDKAIARAKAAGMIPVGFFRSHTRKGLTIDADDRKLLDLRFGDPHCIALLIRPFAAKASTAGIFIKEDGEIKGDTSYLEFPFRSSHCVAAAAKPAPPAGARAQIVPIASRREPVLADLPLAVSPVPAPELAAPVAAVPEPAPTPAHAPAPVAAPVARPKVEPAELEPEPKAEQLAPEAEKPRSKKVYAYAGAAALAVAGLVSVAYFGGLHRGGATVPTQDAGLSLRVERSATELLLTWNRDSAAIKNATRAVLEISDGTQHENVEMDLAQLRNGTIVYSPVTADVVFKMDITGKDLTQLASESVRVLRTRPSPLTPDNPLPAPGAQPPVQDKAAHAVVEPAPEEEAKPAGPPRVTKPFNTESLSQRLRPATATDMPDAPSAAREAAVVPSLPAGLGNASTALPAPPPPTPPEKAPAALGGQIQNARLVSKKDPEYSKMARDAGAKGIVKLIATVGADGRVLRVKAVSGHPLLIRPATEAVMQWIYRPTYLNGVAVETETDIQLNFVNDR